MRLALTRDISPSIVRCELTHLARSPIDLDRARDEHAEYEQALRDLGCTVKRLEAGEDQPDSVFIEDTAVVLEDVAVLTRPGAESRRGEIRGVAIALGEHRPLHTIEAPGTLDGGDVLRVGKALFVGIGPRTNADGITQLRAILAPRGYTVNAVRYRGCLHLKSAATAITSDRVLLNPAWVDAGDLGGLYSIDVDPSEPFAANALRFDETVVHPLDFPRTRARLEAAGVAVRSVRAGELAKAEGGVTCCSLIVDVR